MSSNYARDDRGDGDDRRYGTNWPGRGGRDRTRDRYDGGLGGGGAGHLARIHGTEEDRVNCPFYFKIGACRHGERCSRIHNKPVFSQTILLPQFYQNPLAKELATTGRVTNVPKGYDLQPQDDDFEDFFLEIFEELSKYGEVEEVVVCENLGDHLVGNVYVKYYDEEDAEQALQGLKGRFYAGRQLHCEYSPVTDFREARCRQYHDNTCNRGGECNFIHTKRVRSSLLSDLHRLQKFAGKRSRPDTYESQSSSDSDGESGGAASSKSSGGRRDSRKRRRSRSGSGSRSRSGHRSRRREKDKEGKERNGESRHRDHRSRERTSSKDRRSSRDRTADKGRSRDRTGDRERSRDRTADKERSRDRTTDKERSRDRDRSREKREKA